MKTLRTGFSLLIFSCGALTLPIHATGPGAADFEAALLAMSNVDPDAAGPAMRKAAEAGHVEAMFQLASLHLQGYGVSKSDAEAMRWYGAAADKGHAEAAKNLASMRAADRNKPVIQTSPALPSPDKTSPSSAQSAPAELYAAAKPLRLVPARHAEARRLFEQAVAAGHVPSMIDLAEMIATGQGGARDPDAALALFRRAADTGETHAVLRLSQLYFRPSIGSYTYNAWRDLAAGQALLENLASAGDVEAMVRLAGVLETGTGGVRDVSRSLEMWEKAVAAGRASARAERDRVRDNLNLSPEQKLARYRAALQRAASHRDPSQQRGFALSTYIHSIYGAGLDLEQTAEIVLPIVKEMVETDFHAVYAGRLVALLPWTDIYNQALDADQLRILGQLSRFLARHPGVPDPGIAAGQGWSAAYPDGPPPALATVPKPAPVAAAARPSPAQVAKPAPQLSKATRDASTWDEFFTASARDTVSHRDHAADVKLFLEKHPATAEQLRAAYRRARDAVRPTPGTVRGREFGAQFVAYHLAILATGLSAQAAAEFVRADFQTLARSDVQSAHQVLMGVERPNIALFRPFLTTQQNQQIRDLADLVIKRQPLPTVPDPSAPAIADPAKAAAALYADLIAKLDAREKGVAFIPDEEKALEEFSRLLPLAAKQSGDAYSRRINERIQAEPGAADVFAGNTAWRDKKAAEAFRLLQKAAAAGNSHAKINLAGWFANDVADVPALTVEQRKALVREAHAAGNPGAPAAFINVLIEQRPPDLDEIAKWAKAAVERDDPRGPYLVYFTLLRQRLALARDPLRALKATKPENARAYREELDAALALLRDAAVRGRGDAMFELARYHQHGGLPGLRPTFAFKRPGHNLPLARFWFSRALEVGAKDINESNLAVARKAVAEIDTSLAAAKGRPWKADEVVAALDAGIPPDHVSWLLAREDATFTKSEHTRILTSDAGRKLDEYGMLLTQLGFMVQTGPGNEAAELAAAAVAERRRTVAPLPHPGDDLAALRRRHEAGDPAASYALLRALSSPDRLVWPDDMPTLEQLAAAALSGDYAPAGFLRADTERLVYNLDRSKRDLPRAFALTLASARAGSAEAARRVADFYRGFSGENAVRPNFTEAEWWYAQAAALAWPGELSGGTGILDPERTLARLYAFERADLGLGVPFNARDPAVHRWARELRRRGGAAQTLADEKVAYYGTSDAGNHKLEPLIAGLPPELPLFAPDELVRLENEAAAGRVESQLALARALAIGERGLRQDDARAVALYRRAAEAGSTDAMGALAEHLREGYGVTRDLREALAWQDRAEGKTRSPANALVEAARLAALHRDTHHVVEPYLREAIALGDATAMQTLGSHLTAGRVLKKDVEEGLRLLHQAAEAGNVSAMTGLGLRYRTGDGVPTDPEAGHRWRVRAAEAGDTASINALVDDFDRGRNGAPKDAREALRWARLAAPDQRNIRDHILPRLEREVAALDRTPGATTESLRHEQIARQGQALIAATLAQAAAETAAFDPAPIHAAIAERGDFQLVNAPGRAASPAADQPLEAALPRLQNALAEARGDPQRLLRALDELVARHPDRAEPLIARAQIAAGLPNQQALFRASLDAALKIAPFHPQAHALLARLEIAEGQRERAFRRMAEMAALRPRSIQIATTEAELLVLLDARPAARAALRARIAPLLDAATPADRFAALIASAKLAAGMNDLAGAATDLDAALALNRDPRLLLERAGLRERMQNYPGAVADYTAVLDGPLGRNLQQAAPIRERLEKLQQTLNAETERLREETSKLKSGLERVREADSPEARQRMGDRVGAAMEFVAGNRAYEAGDIEKARELWTKATAAGHKEAAERLKTLPPRQP